MEQFGIVYAINSKGVVRPFTRSAWDLLGNNKNGWALKAEQPVKNLAAKVQARPGTGEQKIKDVSKVADKIADTFETKKTASTDTESQASEETIQAFYAATDGLNNGPIKDYFDAAEPRIAYDKRAKKEDLIKQLGQVLNYDIVLLQKIFFA